MELQPSACVLQDVSESGDSDLPGLIAASRAQSQPTIYSKMAQLQAGTAPRLYIRKFLCIQTMPAGGWPFLRHLGAALACYVHGCTAIYMSLRLTTSMNGIRYA